MLELAFRSTILGNGIQWGRIGAGPAMIAIHGTPFSSQVWRRIIPHLAQHWTVYYYDLAGYGASEMREGQDVSLGVQNDILEGLIREWGLTRPHILAHDFGGATALRAHILNGLEYASLTLIDPVSLAPWGSPLVQHVRSHSEAFAGMPAYMHRAMLDEYLQGSVFRRMSPDVLEIHAKPWTGPVGQPAFYRQIAQMDQVYTDEIFEQLTRLPFPTQVIWGEEDQWIPIGTGEKLAEMISDKPLIRVPDAGHLMQEDRPEAILSHVLSSLLAV
ncbi:MAG: alpha/beta hydrolase [Ponticaulis sp.]|nr:alpha/beta hydrolase [Ponticaulis sp.]